MTEEERLNISKKSRNYSNKKQTKIRYGLLPPLGITYLAAYIRKFGFSPKIIDPIAMEMDDSDILDFIKKTQAPVIGLSSLTSTYEIVVMLAKKIRKEFPDEILIVGGHHINLIKEKTLVGTPFDFAVLGEGELTLLDLMLFFQSHNYERKEILQKTEELKKILGIFYREYKQIETIELTSINTDSNSVYFTGKRPLISDLNEVPMPARDLLPMHKYIPLPIEYKRLPAAHVMISRGCPFNCTYCSTHAAFGYKVRYKSPENVIDEIRYLQKNYKVRQISFWDDTLTINRKWMEMFCTLLIESKINILWNCYAHVTTVDYQLLKLMKKAGCFCVWYGIESGNEDLLKIIRKHSDLKVIKKAVRDTQKAGIEIRGLFMLGLPGETAEKALKTINFAIELDLDYAQFTLTTPHIGTQLYDDAKNYGTLIEDHSRFTQSEAVFTPYGYKNTQELLAIRRKAYIKFYMRPRYIFKFIAKIHSWEDIKRLLSGTKLFLKISE